MESSIPYLGEGLALFTAAVWAFAVILFKKSGEKVHPIGLNLFKSLLALILFIPTMWVFGEPLLRSVPTHAYMLMLLSGAIGIGFADTMFFKSLNLLGAGLIAIVDCLYSPFIIGLAIIWIGESLTPLQILGVLLIISAVLIATHKKGRGKISRQNLFRGIIYGVVALAAMAIGIIMIKPLLEYSPLLWATEIRLFGGVITLWLILLFHPARRKIIGSVISTHSWTYTIAGSFFGAYVAMLVWLGGMKYTQASIASALNQTSSVFIFIFAALILKEPINARRVVGIILAFIGSFLVSFG
jgi:drug/metabolite transporter (DMT)-like permease